MIKERNYSIDALRILSMLMIVILHSVSHGTSGNHNLEGVNVYSLWFRILSSICLLAVNIYVLISGYFLVNEKFRISKLFKMIVETAFYSWIIIILKYFFYNGVGIDAQSLISAFLPISYNVYWFVSAYVGMYILFPVVNLLVHGITRKQHLGVILILVSYFSLWNSVIPFSQPMGINRFGYSVIWFLVLYLIAAYIRLYVTNFSTKKICLFFILTIAFINFSWLALSLVGIMLGISISSVFTEYYYHYNSFPVLIASVSFFLLFKNVCIKSDVIRKIIRFASPLCFGVYLIHDNPNIRDIVWSFLPQYETLSISYPFVVAFYALAIFIGCLFIDYFRSVLFGIINRREWYKALLAKADAFVYSAYNVITSRLLNR